MLQGKPEQLSFTIYDAIFWRYWK